MTNQDYPAFTKIDGIKEFFFRYAAKGFIPYHWYNKCLPEQSSLKKAELPLKLEIVSHCWNYSHLLIYQLSSLAKYPISNCQVVHTVFYSPEDSKTKAMLEHFASIDVANLTWNFVELPKEQLFRRAIGRNMAAKQSTADWLWFTDCDVVFHRGSLDQLAEKLAGRQEHMVYPQQMQITELLKKDDPMLKDDNGEVAFKEIDPQLFTSKTFSRATGPIQIVHGDVARACGYCDNLPVYQKSMARWSKCYDDRAFRWQINSQGVPIDLSNVFFIRHAEKGRYKKDSALSKIRQKNRQVRSALFNR